MYLKCFKTVSDTSECAIHTSLYLSYFEVLVLSAFQSHLCSRQCLSESLEVCGRDAEGQVDTPEDQPCH